MKHSRGIVLLHVQVHVLDLFISRNEQGVMSAGEIEAGKAERHTLQTCLTFVGDPSHDDR